jgi:hypothetical protein
MREKCEKKDSVCPHAPLLLVSKSFQNLCNAYTCSRMIRSDGMTSNFDKIDDDIASQFTDSAKLEKALSRTWNVNRRNNHHTIGPTQNSIRGDWFARMPRTSGIQQSNFLVTTLSLRVLCLCSTGTILVTFKPHLRP